MAKTDAGILSFGARKRLGLGVTFRQHKGKTIAQKRTIPGDPNTAAQQPQRQLFKTIIPWWKALLDPSRETYRLINPGICQNAAYINFMGWQLMHQLVDHHEQHEKAQGDPLRIEKQDSSTVGPSTAPLMNYVGGPPFPLILSRPNAGSTGMVEIDLSPWVPAQAIAIHLTAQFRDDGSARNFTYLDFILSAFWPLHRCVGPHINDEYGAMSALFPFFIDHKFYYQVLASGANSADAYIWLLGWVEPAEE